MHQFFLIFLFFVMPAFGETLRFLETGEESLAARIQSIQDAKSFIYIETFYLGDDQVGHLILSRLLEKKKTHSEIDIRIVTDGLGSSTKKKSTICSVLEHSISWKIFYPIRLNAPKKSQMRDHRKIWITENSSIIGGRNLSRENLSKWDADIEIKGEINSKIRDFFVAIEGLSQRPDCQGLQSTLPTFSDYALTPPYSKWP